MTMRSILLSVIGAGVLMLGGMPQAEALITFDFNSLADGATNGTLDTYMENQIGGPGGTNVVVTGARAENNYFGDNHVTGPIKSFLTAHTPPRTRYRVEPITLGTSDGYFTGAPASTLHAFGSANYDTYLVNKDSSDRIVMQFDFPIYQISFDYEIFPDGTCPNGNALSCEPTDSNWPDFKFEADDVEYFRTIGIMPGQGGTYPSSSAVATTGVGNTELAPQFIGTSGLLTFEGGVSKLEFIDWPRMIGIDNLQICTDKNECLPPPPPPVIPEPSSMFLLGSGLLGAIGFSKKKSRTS